MILTQEQENIVHSKYRKIIVRAFAGTGKTSTLREFAAVRPRQRFLYLAFNKAIQLEANGTFGANVTVKTSHSIAYRYVGRHYKHKLEFNIKPLHIMDEIPDSIAEPIQYLFASVVIKTLKKFMASTHDMPSKWHIPLPPDSPAITPSGEGFFSAEEMSLDMAEVIVRTVIQIWSKMCDKKNTHLPMVHDGYLKLYQLTDPVLDYDVILFDEAQDANPVTAEIILNQNANLVLVGDPYQSIYGFRYAENAIQNFEQHADAIFYLTQSFRFGANIAYIANSLLKTFKQETQSLVGLCEYDEIDSVDTQQFHLNIARTNEKIFEICAKAVSGKNKKKIHFVGGINGYNFDRINDAYWFYRGKKVKDREISAFKNWDDMSKYVEETEDSALTILCRIVLEYKSKVPKLVKAVKNSAAERDNAHFAVSTGHKCKGLEFDQVILHDDFPSLLDEQKKINLSLDPQVINLLYVCITRARKKLELNKSLTLFFNH